jgi:WD40 repeat protein
LAVRPDGRRVASAGANQVNLWDVEQPKPLVQLQDDPSLAAQVAKIDAEIAFTKSAIAVAKQDIKAYEGPERRIMTTAEAIKKAEAEVVKAEKTRDEKKEALEKAQGDEKKVAAAEKALQDAETAVGVAGTVVERAKVVADRAVKNLADAQQGVANNEELLKQQEAARGTAAAALKANRPVVRSLAFSAGNDLLAVGCDDGAVHFYRADNGKPAQSQVEHTAAVASLAFTASELLITCSADRRAVAWSAPGAWRLERTIGQLEHPELLADRVLAVDFSRDGAWLATGGGVPSRSGELKIWSVADGTLIREIPAAHADTVFGARFSPDGKQLASAAADRLVKLFDAESGQQVRSFAGHTAHVLAISFSGDGRYLVSSGSDNVAKLWDVAAGQPLRTYKGTMYRVGAYKGEVTAVSFVGSSEQVLAACGDGTIRLHRTSSDNEIVVYSGAQGYQYAAAATPDGQTLIAGGSDGILRVWSGQERAPKQTFAPAH